MHFRAADQHNVGVVAKNGVKPSHIKIIRIILDAEHYRSCHLLHVEQSPGL